ncbi:uncharacterized protein LOC117104572 [Anneissia japonica]|uniref:uncharacterized protein LOC117104572 n=1 Tax=Anneissia japonica TaxID=1529436 RepID=UPI0014257186|nr:uncharacterized protein LOC117104572 [Anneissia japonica]
MHLRFMVLLLSVLVLITCTEAPPPPECMSPVAQNRPSHCQVVWGRKALNTLERLLKKELIDEEMNTEERNLGDMEEAEGQETRNLDDENQNLYDEVRFLELLLDLKGENNIKK